MDSISESGPIRALKLNIQPHQETWLTSDVPTPHFQTRISDCLDLSQIHSWSSKLWMTISEGREPSTQKQHLPASCFPFLWGPGERWVLDRALLCNLGCPEFNPPASASRMLGLQVCATVPDLLSASQFSIGSRFLNTKEQKQLQGI